MHPVSRQAGLLLLLTMPSVAGAQTSDPRATDASRPAGASPAAHADRPRVQAVVRTGNIKLDGVLDDAVWAAAPVATNFTQQDPDEGKPASEQTEVRFVYDDDALYIGARMHGEKVRTRLVRRDQIREGDNLMFVFDTYHDHAGRTVLQVNPSGAKFDAGQASPNADASWDPVWDVATKIDDKGWTAEMRIPWAQLRFPKDSVQSWGVQIWRYIEHRNELDMWSFWGKKESGGPQHFGHIENIHVSQKHGGLELLPYVVGKAAYQESSQPGSPFHDDSDFAWRAGGDVKALLTSTLTLDATINPDFGQVEVDPAVVNLSAFETFFSEKRPFFVSGGGIFGFGGFGCFYCSNVSAMSLFYSRRIGRSAQGFVSQPAQYTLMPENTTILGAAKITGRTAGGLQIGLLNALTASEKAKAISPSGQTFSEEVEPMSNYFVGRAKKTYRNGDYTFGAIGTSVVRRFDNPALKSLLPGHAEAVGFDWNMGWKKRTFSFQGNFALTDVAGDTATIRRLQRTSARYFQRPDREHGSNSLFTDKYDPTLTTMRGYGGYARLAKDAGSWRGEIQTNYRSPGFEVNDLAFNTRSDYRWFAANVAHAYTKPNKWYRRADWTVGTQRQFNYDGDLTDAQFHAWAGGQTLFNWWLTGSVQYRPEVYDDRLTRGGPVARRAAVKTMFYSIQSDSRKKVVLGLFPGWTWTDEGGRDFNVSAEVRFKPATNLEMTFSPYYNDNHSMAQYVTKFTDATATNFYGQRVVFAEIDQKSLQFNTRVSATFTPTLTLEVVLQPFVSTGDYNNFKEFVAARTVEKRVFDAMQITAVKDASGRVVRYSLDPDRNSATTNFTLSNPDFNFRSLRGNAVLRWEYRPGSTLFLVWQQQRAGQASYGDFDVSRDVDAIFKGHADNIFLVKMSYWLPR